MLDSGLCGPGYMFSPLARSHLGPSQNNVLIITQYEESTSAGGGGHWPPSEATYPRQLKTTEEQKVAGNKIRGIPAENLAKLMAHEICQQHLDQNNFI